MNAPSEHPTILVLEDDLRIASLLVDELTHNGYLVDVVANGAEGECPSERWGAAQGGPSS